MPDDDQLLDPLATTPIPPGTRAGMTLDDLALASERTFDRGWEAACAHVHGQVEERVRRIQADARRDVEQARDAGYAEGYKNAEEYIGESMKDPAIHAGYLVAGLKRVIAELPKSTPDSRRTHLLEELKRAERIKAALDKVKR